MSAGRVAIVGIGHSAFERRLDSSPLQLSVDVAKAAVDDAGLPLRDVDGLLLRHAIEEVNPRAHMALAEVLGLYDTPLCTSLMMGGATAGHAVELARWALLAGRCKYVLVVAASRESAVGGPGGYTKQMATLTMHYPDYEHPFGATMPAFYALLAQRHMHEYGTTPEQLASIPVAFRHNAGLNPAAVYREPIDVEDVLDSPPIATPLHRLHCCIVNDGAIAFLLTTEERAKDLRQPPVYVLGSGGGQAGYYTGFLAAGGADEGYSLTRTLAGRAADDAFAEAGVGREDVDLVTTCDNFAISPLIQLENYGFCDLGEGGSFIGRGGERIRVGGALPVNPHGGMLSCNHAAANFQNYTEATLQLRGQAGDRQVEGAEIAFASASAGISSTHYAQVLASR